MAIAPGATVTDILADSDDDLTAETRVEVPAEVAARGASASGPPVETPQDVMHRREIEGTRRFAFTAVTLSAAVAVALPFIDTSRGTRGVIVAGFVIGLVGITRTLWKLRAPERYSTTDAAIFAATCSSAGSCGIYYFGFFSPAPLATVMGIFFFSLGRRGVAIVVYIATALIHGVAMTLMMAGVIADRGVVTMVGVTSTNGIILTVLTQVVFLLTFLIARSTNDAMLRATEELQENARALAAREALLDEARRELDRVLEPGGPGRFTEQRLGNYDLGVLRGRGAMGDIYEGRHVDTGQAAAVKLLHREVLGNPSHIRRFLREARIASSINVPNVVEVYEIGDDDAPVPYLAMELLEGRDLGAILRRTRRMDPDAVVEMLRQVGKGVDAAHRAGVVHRDLKPHNLFRAEINGTIVWKILDFGIARLIDAQSTLTKQQAVGTPSYMSPEQARGRNVDHTADLFALGIVAYRTLTGRPPFSGSEIPEIMYNVVHQMPPQPSRISALPGEVDAVLAVALAKRPRDRFTTAAELVAALDAALIGSVSSDLGRRSRQLLGKHPWGTTRG